MSIDLKPFTVDDLYRLPWIEDVQLRRDGRMIAYVQVSVDRVHNSYRRAIYVAASDGGPARRFTRGRKNDHSPRWSPDGKRLAFVSQRDDERGQIYLIALGGGEAQQLTALANGASAPSWSPDGRQIAFLGRANEAERAAEDRDEPPAELVDAWQLQRDVEQRKHDEELRSDPRVISRLPYRSGTNFFDDRRSHVYVVQVPDEDVSEPAQARRITDGDLHYAAPSWMPDGQSILTTATRDPEADSIFAYYDVLRVPISGEKPTILTAAGFSCFDPQPSPDGTQIAFSRLPEDRLLAAGNRVAVIASEGGEPVEITLHTDLNVEQFRWQPDGKGIYFQAGWRGGANIYSTGLPGTATYRHSTTILGGRRLISDFAVAEDGTFAFIAGTSQNPCELFLRQPDGTERQITQLNAALLAERRVAPCEEILYHAPDEAEVQGWVLSPPDFDPKRHYPLAVYIHGGPHVMWGPGFRSMWHEWQAVAAQGYIVFFCNPRGSEGYGEQWRDGIRKRWGEADADDIHAGIDALIARGYVDPDRIAVTGGSYGGFMSTWLISHSDRFACAVSARGVYNLLTEHSTSDAHELIEIEFDGYPWEIQEELWDHSPIAHAHKINTPLLILHGELDYRVPISEAEQLFAILRRQKKAVELVRYPREGHDLTRTGEPLHRVDHMRRTIQWFDRYCRER